MSFETLDTGIRLETSGDCPFCGRPLLGLAQDRCGFCGSSLEGRFPALPEVAARMAVIARGWTPEAFTEWVQPRPDQLLWALGTCHWKNLGYWVHEDLWRLWARLFANLKGRWKARTVEGLELESAEMCGIGEFQPWVRVRIKGRRVDLHSDPLTGQLLHGSPEPVPFREVWTFAPTGQPMEKTEHQCSVCGGGLDFTDLDCPYCGCPLAPTPGPWILVAVRAESTDQMLFRSPFEASVSDFSSPE
jgi:hypothetical protein